MFLLKSFFAICRRSSSTDETLTYSTIGVSLATYMDSVTPCVCSVAPVHVNTACFPPGRVTELPFASSVPKTSALPSTKVTATALP